MVDPIVYGVMETFHDLYQDMKYQNVPQNTTRRHPKSKYGPISTFHELDYFKEIIDQKFNTFINYTKSLNEAERVKAYDSMFRYLFYLCSIRDAEKKSRILFYYLFTKLYPSFPRTCNALLKLVPDFGYFGDIINIMNYMSGRCQIEVIFDIYIKHLDADCIQIFGMRLGDVNMGEAIKINTFLNGQTDDKVKRLVGSEPLSFAAIWIDTETITDDNILQIYEMDDDDTEVLRVTHPEDARKRFNYYRMLFRKVIMILRKCLSVSANGSAYHNMTIDVDQLSLSENVIRGKKYDPVSDAISDITKKCLFHKTNDYMCEWCKFR
jgi:hypothetical protein